MAKSERKSFRRSPRKPEPIRHADLGGINVSLLSDETIKDHILFAWKRINLTKSRIACPSVLQGYVALMNEVRRRKIDIKEVIRLA